MDEALSVQYSESNQYFLNENNLLLSLWCVNPLDIDTYIKRSFSASYQTVTLTGALVEAFTKDHIVDERFVIYQVPAPGLPFQGTVSLTPNGKSGFSWSIVKGLLQGMPVIALLVLSLVSFVLPAAVAKVFRDIVLVGLGITYLYYSFKIVRSLFKTVKAKGLDYHGVTILCSDPSDLGKVNDTIVDTLQALRKEYFIPMVVYRN